MPRHHGPVRVAAGQLTLAIQREWAAEMGEPSAAQSESVMHASHAFLGAADEAALAAILGGASVERYLGEAWVRAHPAVHPQVQALQAFAEVS